MTADNEHSTSRQAGDEQAPAKAVVSEDAYRKEQIADTGSETPAPSVRDLAEAGAGQENAVAAEGAEKLTSELLKMQQMQQPTAIAQPVTHPQIPAPAHTANHAGISFNGHDASAVQDASVAALSGTKLQLASIAEVLQRYSQEEAGITVRLMLTPIDGSLYSDGSDAVETANGALVFIGDPNSLLDDLSHLRFQDSGDGAPLISVRMIPIASAAGNGDEIFDNPNLTPYFANLMVSENGQTTEQSRTAESFLNHDLTLSSGESLAGQHPSVENIDSYSTLGDREQPAQLAIREDHQPIWLRDTPVNIAPPPSNSGPLNHAPTGELLSANSVVEGASNGTVIGTVSTIDPDSGNTHHYSLTSNAGGVFAIDANTGVVTVADGSLLDFATEPVQTITVVTIDQGGLSFQKNFTIQVTDLPPGVPADSNAAANAVTEGASSGSQVGITASALSHGGALTYSLSSDTTNGGYTIDTSTGVVTVADGSKINYDTATSDVITVRVSDASGAQSDANFTINVAEVALTGITDSDATANSVSEGASNGATVGVTALATNPHSDAVAYSLTNNDSGAFTIDASTGVVTVADATKLNYDTASSMTVGVEATEASGQHVDQNFTISVGEVALTGITDTDATVNSVSEGASNGATVGVTAAATNPHNDAVTYSLTNNDGGAFTIDAATGVITVADATKLNYDTASSMTVGVRATEVSGQHADQNFTINIAQVGLTGITDSDVTANSVSWSGAGGTAVGITAQATDPHNDAVTYSLTNSDGGAFTIDSGTGVVTVADPTKLNAATTPDPTITVRATEASGQHVDQNFTISVGDDAPTTTGPLDTAVVTSASATTAVSVDTHTLFADADLTHGDSLTYNYSLNTQASSVAMPGWLTFNTTTGVFSGTAPIGYTQDLNFTITATDSAGESVSTTADLGFGAFTNLGTTGGDITSGTAIYGDAGGDSLTGTANSSVLNGGAGDDSITGSVVNYGSVNSDLFGGDGNDTINSYRNANTSVYGGNGNDSLSSGYVGLLSGGAGNDTLYSSTADRDTLTGGTGADLFKFGSTALGSVVTDFTQGTDLIGMSNGFDDITSGTPEYGELTYSISGSNTVVYTLDNSFSFTLQNFTGTLTDADFIFGGNGTGTTGADTITGTGTQIGLAGDDSLKETGGNVRLFGDTGNDTLVGINYDTLYGGSGNDSLVGNGGNGDNYLYGGSGNDTLVGYDRNEVLTGGSGSDVFKYLTTAGVPYANSTISDFTQGTDLIELDNGFDHITSGTPDAGQLTYSVSGGNTIIYDSLTGFKITVDNFTGTLTDSDFVFSSGGAGTSGNDTLSGSGSVLGLAGNDSLTSTYYYTALNGGAGNDTIITGSYYAEILFGGAGDDSITSTTSSNGLFGGTGNDTIISAGSYDTLSGGSGEDIFKFTSAIHYGSVITDFNQSTDGDKIDLTTWTSMHWDGTAAMSGSVNQVDYSQSGGNTIVYVDTDGDNASNFSFTLDGLYTLTREDFIFNGDTVGTSGNDTISGSGFVFGMAGNDSLTASANGTVLIEGNGQDTLSLGTHTGGSLFGGSGGDSMVSNGSGDSLQGGIGNDTISTAGNHDTLTGGAGADVFKFTAVNSGSHITDFVQGTDKIELGGLIPEDHIGTTGDYGELAFSVSGSNTVVYTADSSFSFTLDNFTGTLTDADFTFDGNGTGTTGADTINSTGTLVGLAGDDSIVSANGSGTKMYGGVGNDTLIMNANDTGDNLYGGSGNDSISIGHSGFNHLYGGSGNDTLATLGTGDTLTGGSGSDVFKFISTGSGSVITDFVQGTDQIEIDTGFDHLNPGTPDAGDLSFSINGSNTE